MPTITLKNIPDDLYKKVKKRAKMNRRSINGEILYVLEQAGSEAGNEKDQLLEEVRKLRISLPRIKNIEEIDDFKKLGRS